MQPILIIGTFEKNRIHKVEEIVGKKISKLENNPDFFLLEAAETSIGIEDVRSLQKYISLKPYQEDKKIVLIKEAQNLTVEAQNALLKTLEEPPETVHIILTVRDSGELIPTIISRCHVIDLGSQKSPAASEEDEKNLLELLQKIISSTSGARLKIVEGEGITKDRTSAIKWLDKLTFALRNYLVSKYLSPKSLNPYPLNPLNIALILQQISQAKKYLETNCNIKLVIDNFLLNLP